MALARIFVVVLASSSLVSQESTCFLFGPNPAMPSSAAPVLQADNYFPLLDQTARVKTPASASSRRQLEKVALRLSGPQRVVETRQELSDQSAVDDAMSEPDENRSERDKRQLGSFDSGNPQRPNNGGFNPQRPNNGGFNPQRPNNGEFNPQRPNNGEFNPQRQKNGVFNPQRPNNGGFNPQRQNNGGGFFFPTDPPSWANGNGNGNPPRRPSPQRPPRPGQGSRPTGSENFGAFVFGGQPPQPPQPPPRVTTKRPSRPATPASPTTPRRPARVTRPTPATTRAGCNCPTTPEFNPVCGADRVTYSNPGKLRCANFCGNTVEMVHLGSCITSTTPAPTTPSNPPAGVGVGVGANRRVSWP